MIHVTSIIQQVFYEFYHTSLSYTSSPHERDAGNQAGRDCPVIIQPADVINWIHIHSYSSREWSFLLDHTAVIKHPTGKKILMLSLYSLLGLR